MEHRLIARAKKWCWEKEIKIYPFPIVSNGSRMKIIKEVKGKPKTGDIIFTNTNNKIYEKINAMYVDIFTKNNKKYEIENS